MSDYPNFLERAIAFVSPEAALKRARHRSALDVVLAYEGARQDRRTQGWVTGGSSVNSDLGMSLPTLRQRSRDLVQNNPHAARALEIIKADAVGTGIVPRAVDESDSVNRAAQEAWDEFADNSNVGHGAPFYAQQGLVVKSLIQNGEAVARFLPRPSSWGLTIPLQVQGLESDQLDLMKHEETEDYYTIHGVRRDRWGRVLGYWLYQVHPGESLRYYRGTNESQFHPARDIMHVFDQVRDGQVRGVPWFAPVLIKFRDMAELDEAELVKNKIQACVVGIVTQSQGEEGATLGGVVTDAAGNRVEKFRPGMLAYGLTGADIKFNNPSGNSTFSDFWTKQLQSIAVGMNVMYEHLSGDLSNVNYSSFRGGMQIYRPFIESLRWNILIPLYCKPTWERVMQVAWGLGRIPKPKVRVDWTPPKFMSVDPKKDADSDQMELRDGTLTWPEAVARKGYDPEQQFQTPVKWKNRFAEAGLILDCDPSVTDASGKQKVAPNEEKPKQQQRERREQAILAPESQIEVFAATLAAADGGGQRLADCVFYSGSTVLRIDYWTGEKYNLTLSMKPEHVRLGRLNNGAPVLDSHSSWGIGSVLGVVEKASLDGGRGVASLRFSERSEVEPIWNDVQAGILRNVSMGSQIHKLKDVTKEDEKMKSYLAVDWEPVEISLVGVPADAGAGFLSAQLGLDDIDTEELAAGEDLVVAGAASQQQTLLSLLLRQRQQWQ